ncbi:hypothetical protein CHS0354_038921 [Potamilus streckersoni]|uniref:Uncharacterized protein n=1 Tax=Potamilus streckersoni TaxID=2493646 RepID=A0AAE0S0W1_9BIVA|nr:hypothetical protein CHS0354_038921 [Potamilus streckersoni]
MPPSDEEENDKSDNKTPSKLTPMPTKESPRRDHMLLHGKGSADGIFLCTSFLKREIKKRKCALYGIYHEPTAIVQTPYEERT